MQISKKRHSFDYESLLDVKKDQWILTFQIPLYGEEVFFLDYRDAYKGPVKVNGSFYNKIKQRHSKYYASAKSLKLLEKHIEMLAIFFKFYTQHKKKLLPKKLCSRGKQTNGKYRGICKILEINRRFVWKLDTNSDDFTIDFKLSKNRHFIVKALDLYFDHYKRVNLSLVDTSKGSNPSGQPIEINLFSNNCTMRPQQKQPSTTI